MMKIDDFCQIVAKGLEVDASMISPNTTADEIDAWDSLGHLTLLMHLDQEFDGISKDVPELGSTNSVMEIYELIAHKLP